MTIPIPDQMFMEVPELDAALAYEIAVLATSYVRKLAPKVTGASASRIEPLYGQGFFGVTWADDHVWFQEVGIKPFTMTSLQGKTIPLWIDDPYGIEAQKNPRAERRTTADGRNQILIFRKAARVGERRTKTSVVGGRIQTRSVPAPYPGAPGRVSRRVSALGATGSESGARIAGKIAPGATTVRWRHPGLSGKGFITEGIRRAAFDVGVSGIIRHASSEGDPRRLRRPRRKRTKVT